eukprot:m51a1_g4213 hypothetical protein (413) ;mRNA; f:69859-71620
MKTAALLLLCFSIASSVPCGLRTLDAATGKTWAYDLRALSHADGQGEDMAFTGTASTSRYYLNVCGSTSRCPGSAACMQDALYNSHALGALQSIDIFPSETAEAGRGVRVTYGQGEECVDEANVTRARTATVYVGCTEVEGRSWIGDVREGLCDTTYHVWSAYACATEVAPEPQDNDTMPLTYVATDVRTGRRWSYNLSSLNHPRGSGADLTFSATDTGSTFYLNLGGSTLRCPGSAVCEQDALYRLHSWGRPATQAIGVYPPDVSEGVVVSYGLGEQCDDGSLRSVSVAVRCSAGAERAWIGEVRQGNCSDAVVVWSAAGCGTALDPPAGSSSSSSSTASSAVPPAGASSSSVSSSERGDDGHGFRLWWVILVCVAAAALIGAALWFAYRRWWQQDCQGLYTPINSNEDQP